MSAAHHVQRRRHIQSRAALERQHRATMAERATMEIASQSGTGTTVRVTLPLD